MERIFHKKVLRYSNPSLLCSSFSLSPKGLEYSSSSTLLYSNLHLDSVHKKPYFYDSSSGLSLFCNFDSGAIEKSTSLNKYSCGLHSRCHFDYNLLHKETSLSNFSYGKPSSFRLFIPSSRSSKTLTINSIHRFHNRRHFSASSSGISVHSEGEVVLDEDGWKRKGKGKRKGRRVYGPGMDLTPKIKSNIIEIIKSGEHDMEVKVSSMPSELSVESITEIFEVLNCQKISGLRFFRWIRANNPRLYFSADFCSLIISNCGWLDDYDTMSLLLNEFKLEKICLRESAFWFLPVFMSSQSSLADSVGRLVNLLNEVGGSCFSSGIFALIQMFCRLDLFNMAKHVMEISGKKSHYDILVKERCRKGHSVSDIIREMTEFGCEPTIKTYNYLVGCLCKQDKMTEAYRVLQLMQEQDVLPDALTYEIFIHKFCNSGNVDLAKTFLNKMANSELEPRLESHTAFLRVLFKSEQFPEAHKYVIDSSALYQRSSSKLYSLLADLYQRKGDLMSSQGIIVEMMEKGHKPDFTVYITIVKKLQKIGQDHLARDLRNMFSRFLE